MAVQLTASLEDYLEAIAELIDLEGHAHTKEIAAKLNVKMPSVTGALRQLEKQGIIVYNAHYPVQLTPEGRRIAREVVHRHSVLTKFFAGILGLSPEKASATACQVEHVVDTDTIRRFVLFSKSIENRSDAKALQIFLSEAMENLNEDGENVLCTLTELSEGECCIIHSIGRNLAGKDLPVAENDELEIRSSAPAQNGVQVRCGNLCLTLDTETAENLWVKKL